MKKMTNIEFARQWLGKADNDLRTAELLLSNKDMPCDVICFHAQQVMEKSLKGLLTAVGVRFERTHNLMVLLESCLVVMPELEQYREVMGEASAYATELRYPGETEEPPISEANDAVVACRSILESIDKRLKAMDAQ